MLIDHTECSDTYINGYSDIFYWNQKQDNLKIYELHSCENQSVIYFYRRCRRCDRLDRLPMLRTDRECEVRTLRSALRCDDSTTLFTNIFRRPLSPGSQLPFLACQKIENISHFLSFSAGGHRAAHRTASLLSLTHISRIKNSTKVFKKH